MTTPVYAITGASGRLGRLAVEQLMARGVPPSDIVVLVRTPAKAISLAASGVQVRQADYSRPATLAAALCGVNRLLLVSGSEIGHLVPQHTNVIEAAKTAGISRIVYTSMLNADHSTSPLAAEHRETERVRLLAQDPGHGALPVLYAVAGIPGNSFAGTSHLAHMRGAPELIGRSAAAQDPDLARRLRTASEGAS